MLPIKKILCPTDFSEPSQRGIEVAVELAENFSAELILINVVTSTYPVGAPGVPPAYRVEEYHQEMMNFATESLEKMEREKVPQGVRRRKVVGQGNAADEIVEQAEREGVELIVIATHGWTGWRRFVFGSVAEKVVRMASIPVLTIPGPAEK